MRIHELKDGESVEWLRMRLLLWPRGAEAEHRREMRELARDPSFVCFLAEEPGTGSVAFAEVSVRSYANGCESRPVPFLEGIWVDPGWRRHGVGSMLVDAIVVWCRARGFVELGSDTDVNNMVSRDAHSTWGFVETERVVYFRKAF